MPRKCLLGQEQAGVVRSTRSLARRKFGGQAYCLTKLIGLFLRAGKQAKGQNIARMHTTQSPRYAWALEQNLKGDVSANKQGSCPPWPATHSQAAPYRRKATHHSFSLSRFSSFVCCGRLNDHHENALLLSHCLTLLSIHTHTTQGRQGSASVHPISSVA